MTRWASRDKGIRGLTRHHLVDRQRRAADRAQRRLVAPWRQRRIGVEPHKAFSGCGFADRFDVFHWMTKRDDIDVSTRSFDTRQRLKLLILQHLFDRAQAVRPLRMPGGRQVV